MTEVNGSKAQASFYEEQRFRQLWLWLLLLAISLSVAGMFIYGMITQFVFGQPWGDEPMSDTGLAIIGPLIIILILSMLYLMYRLKLVIEVRDDGLHIRFFPFVFRKIGFDDIEVCEARIYKPIWEYGGWGVRWMPVRGMAYNVSGNRGVQLVISGGKRLLIGSQRSEELARAIENKIH